MGSKALIPIALNSTEKGERAAAQALARIGITTDPTIAFPGQRTCDVVRPIGKLLKEEVKSLEMFEDHQMLRRAAVQCVLNLCQSEVQVKRFEDKNDKMKYMVLLMGDADDQEVVKAAAGAVATLTSYSSILCNKVYESTQWESCFLNVLCSQDYDIVYRGVVAIANMIEAGKDVADKMMDTKVLDVCQALIIKANMDSSNFEPIPVLAKIKSVAEVALNKAHAMGVIKTYEQAVKEDEDDEELEEWRHHPKAAITDVTDESSS